MQQQGIGISFHGERYRPRPARVTWLRAGYLPLFAVMGYRYIFRPALGSVRRQIREPETEHLSVFLALIPGDHSLTEWCIMRIREPEWQRSWAARFGRYVVFLPLGGETSFYQRLAKRSRAGDGNARPRSCWGSGEGPRVPVDPARPC